MKSLATLQLFLIALMLSACAPVPNSVATATVVSNPTEAAQVTDVQTIAHIQSLAGLPNSALEFVEMTTMINSPDGRLAVALYQDSEGRKFSLEPTTRQVVEIDARARLTHLTPEPVAEAQWS